MERVNPHQLLQHLLTLAQNKVPIFKQLLLTRTAFKMSQVALAKHLGTDQGTVSIVESGRRNVSTKHVNRYAEAFGLQVVLIPRILLPFVIGVVRSAYKPATAPKAAGKTKKGAKKKS